jgi:hypothetical protein
MTATNHALTGSLIGLMVGSPWLAIPLAILSHFLLDAIPHFDVSHKGHNSRALTLYLIFDALFVLILLGCLVTLQPAAWVAAVCGAVAATLPDLMWLPNYFRAHKGKELAEHRHIVLFHKNIQWFERPIGFVVEIAWAIGMIVLSVPFYT